MRVRARSGATERVACVWSVPFSALFFFFLNKRCPGGQELSLSRLIQSYKEEPKEKKNYSRILQTYKQDLKLKTQNAIGSFVFAADSHEPQGKGVAIITGEQATWDNSAGVSLTEIKDPPAKEEEIPLVEAPEHGSAPFAMDSLGRAWPRLGISVIQHSSAGVLLHAHQLRMCICIKKRKRSSSSVSSVSTTARIRTRQLQLHPAQKHNDFQNRKPLFKLMREKGRSATIFSIRLRPPEHRQKKSKHRRPADTAWSHLRADPRGFYYGDASAELRHLPCPPERSKQAKLVEGAPNPAERVRRPTPLLHIGQRYNE